MSKLDDFLSKPTAPARKASASTKDYTVEIDGATASVTTVVPAGTSDQVGAKAMLIARGENPEHWVATGMRASTYGRNGEFESVNYRFARVGTRAAELAQSGDRPPLDDLFAAIKRARPKALRADGDKAFIVALGDTQFGKIDGDGVAGTLDRAIRYLDMCRDLLETHRKRFNIGHVHLAFLGDHIEGFVSQNGANAWRTQLTLNEQIRLTRRVMYHGLELFYDSAARVSMAALPGNHGEPVRFAGKGVTRYDDSHDTEALIAVAEGAAFNKKAYGHVEFYVPTTDELAIVLDLAGTGTVMHHGHKHRIGKHFDWWADQALGGGMFADTQLMLTGHLHHEFIEGRGKLLFAQAPALESESTWYRHARGVPGNPGILTLITGGGKTNQIEVVRD